MNIVSFSWIDYTLFVLMFSLSAVVGIYYGCFGKQQETTADYLLGGKKMKIFPVAMSLVASTLSGISLLAMPAEVYIYGTQFMLMVAAIIFMGVAINFIYLPVFCKLEVTTIFEYLELRFNKKLRTVASILFTITNCVYLPVVIYAPSLAFNLVSGFDVHIIAVVMSSICIFYTTIGGLKAVVWTDTLQFSVTLCTLGCVLVMGTISVGGFGTVWEKAKLGDRIEFFNMDPNPTVRATFWSVFVGSFFVWTAFIAVNPATAQRFLAVPTLKESKKVLIIFISFAAITKTICCFSGLIMYAKYYECDPLASGSIDRADQILPYYVLDVAAQIPGLSGLFAAGLFSTALSTLSTFLNALAGIVYADFIAPFMPHNTSEAKASTIMKLITAVIGFISVGLVFVVERLGTILELVGSLNGATLGPLLGIFTMGMLFPFANKKGGLFGVIGATLFMIFVVVQHQICVWNGNIKHTTKPLYTHGCNQGSFSNANSTLLPTDDSSEELFWLYRISFHYYILMGTLATLIIGLPVSWFTRNKSDLPMNPDLFSPCIQRFLSKSAARTRYDLVQNEVKVLKIDDMTNEMLEYPIDKLLK